MSAKHEIIDAISRNDIDAVRRLAPQLDDLSILTDDGLDLVSFAMNCEAEAAASFVIDCRINLANPASRFTPIQGALECPYYDLIEKLLAKRIDLNVKGTDEAGYPIHVLCEGYLEPELLRRFLALGADPTKADEYGRTAIDIIREHYHENAGSEAVMDEMIDILRGAR